MLNDPRIDHRLRVKDQVSANDQVILVFRYGTRKLMPYLIFTNVLEINLVATGVFADIFVCHF